MSCLHYTVDYYTPYPVPTCKNHALLIKPTQGVIRFPVVHNFTYKFHIQVLKFTIGEDISLCSSAIMVSEQERNLGIAQLGCGIQCHLPAQGKVFTLMAGFMFYIFGGEFFSQPSAPDKNFFLCPAPPPLYSQVISCKSNNSMKRALERS